MTKLSRALALGTIAFALQAGAQSPGPEVRKFLQFEDRVVALRGVRLIDGTGAAATEGRTVILRGDRIEAVGDASLAVPKDAKVLELAGRTVYPGLVGMHNHLMYTASINFDPAGKTPPPGGLVTPVAFTAPRLYLASGVTTIRTTGSIEPHLDLNLRDKIDAGEMPGPRIDVTAPYLEGPGTFFPQMAILRSPEQARRHVRHWAGEGATSFKAYMEITEPVLAAAIDEAHKLGLKVTGHLCAVDWKRAIAIGIDNLEHGPVYTDTQFVPDRKPGTCPGGRATSASWEKLEIGGEAVQGLIGELVAKKVAVTSTLAVMESSNPTRPLMPARQQALMAPESLRSYLHMRALVAAINGSAARQDAAFRKELAFELAFARAGGHLMAGADPTGNGGALPGFADQRGLQLLVEAGFTAQEAIRIATANGAKFLGRDADLGTVEAGKRADLVVVKGDPAKTIADVENVEIVFKDGYAYDPAKLLESVKGMVGIR